LVIAIPLGFPGLCIGLIVAGVGSGVQHPRASLLVTKTYGEASRGPLGIYNFAGDLGKATFPAIVALLLLKQLVFGQGALCAGRGCIRNFSPLLDLLSGLQCWRNALPRVAGRDHAAHRVELAFGIRCR
jgi:hypothetical protein